MPTLKLSLYLLALGIVLSSQHFRTLEYGMIRLTLLCVLRYLLYARLQWHLSFESSNLV